MNKSKEKKKNTSISIFGISKLLRGNILNKLYSGTWGNRGKGNELLSALEKGLSWVGNKIINIDDYIEDGLTYLVGLIPGGKYSANEMVENNKRSREAGSGNYWEDTQGNIRVNPVFAIPIMPTLPANASVATILAYNKLKKLRPGLSVRESQLKKVGLLHKLEETATAKKYREAEQAFQRTLEPAKKHIDDTPLTRKLKMSFKAEKARSTNDLRSANSGRPVMKVRQKQEVIKMMQNDPKGQLLLHSIELKRAKGINHEALKIAEEKAIQDYLKMRPGFFTWLLK